MMHIETVNLWIPVFDYGLCAREFGFRVIGQPDKRRESLRRKVEILAKNAATAIVAECGAQVLEVLDCGCLGYGSENYLGVRVRANVEIPEDVAKCTEALKRLPPEALREQVQILYKAGEKHPARRLDIRAILIGDLFADQYCLSWSATHRQLCIQIYGLDSAYISRNEFLSLTKNGNASTQQTRKSFLQRFKSLLSEW